MTASEVIDLIKALPAEERAAVIKFLQAEASGEKTLADTTFAESAKWVVTEHRELAPKTGH